MPDDLNINIQSQHFPSPTTKPPTSAKTQTKYTLVPPEAPKSGLGDKIYESFVNKVFHTFGESTARVTRAVLLEQFPLDTPEQKAQDTYKYITAMRNWANEIIATGDKSKIENALELIDKRVPRDKAEEIELYDLQDKLNDALHDVEVKNAYLADINNAIVDESEGPPPPHA